MLASFALLLMANKYLSGLRRTLLVVSIVSLAVTLTLPLVFSAAFPVPSYLLLTQALTGLALKPRIARPPPLYITLTRDRNIIPPRPLTLVAVGPSTKIPLVLLIPHLSVQVPVKLIRQPSTPLLPPEGCGIW